jgi:hypothetical protein
VLLLIHEHISSHSILDTLIITEQSFWLSKSSEVEGVSMAIQAFQESDTANAVFAAVQKLDLPGKKNGLNARKLITKELEERNLAGQIEKIVRDNLLGALIDFSNHSNRPCNLDNRLRKL